MVLDRVLKAALSVHADWGYCVRERRSSRELAQYVTDTTYADDIALLSPSFEQAETMLSAVALHGRDAGLEINLDKTNVLVVGDLATEFPARTLSLDGRPIERVANFVYLGSLILDSRSEIAKRIHKASYQTGRLQKVWSAPLSRGLKVRLFRALIDPILFYACETWTTTGTDLRRLTGARNRLLRRALGISWFNRVPNCELYSLADCAANIVEERRLRFLGHVSRFAGSTSERPLNQLLYFRPQGATRRHGQGHRTTFFSQMLQVLPVTLGELRQLATQADKTDFTKFYTFHYAALWSQRLAPPTDEAGEADEN
jgi:hypothetical protein